MIIVFKFVVHPHLVFYGNVFEDKGVVVDLFEAVVRGAETHGSFELVTGFVVVAGLEGGGGSAVGGLCPGRWYFGGGQQRCEPLHWKRGWRGRRRQG